ncbi:TonB-dependent receptor domain-containing protein [Sporomusa termitida]|uniref:Vitamin B12 transporter BtuB n=1 Tax=Sporomusa termitida TaxID=2377 RepID=A0A517DWR2_9FIRM|nr:TonB-dependent receptor [Sporomusa termitida]QDR81794.1 Vitamin B12 transporter BtuB [Sporomusa termitida]
MAKNNGRAKSVRRRCGAKSLAPGTEVLSWPQISCAAEPAAADGYAVNARNYMSKKARKKVICASIAATLGVVCVPTAAWAADGVTLTGDGIITYGNNVGGSAFFKNYDTVSNPVQSTKPSTLDNITRPFNLSAGTLRADWSEYGSPASAGNNLNNFPSIPTTPQINGENANAIAMRVYDQETDSYSYKVVQTNSTQTIVTGNIVKYLNNSLFQTIEVQREIYAAIGDEAQLKAVMEKYLPEFYFVVLNEEQLQAINALGDNSANETTIANSLYDFSVNDSNAIGFNVKLQMAKTGTVTGSTGHKAYTYDQVTVTGTWRPDDRAIIVEPSDAVTYKINTYWITGPDGASYALDYEGNLKVTSDAGVSNSVGAAGTQTPLNGSGAKTVISTQELITGENSLIDLTYVNTVGGRDSLAFNDNGGGFKTGLTYESGGKTVDAYVPTGRTLLADTAILGNGTAFRLGKYGIIKDDGSFAGSSDNVLIGQANQAQKEIDANAKTTLYYEIGWVPGIGTSPFGEGSDAGSIGIYNGAENFEVIGRATTVDGIFSNYMITPEITRYDNYYQTENSKLKYAQDSNGNYYKNDGNHIIIIMNADGTVPFRAADPENLTQEEWDYLKSQGATTLSNTYDNTQGTAWLVSKYTYEDTGEMAESGKSASENSAVLRNVAKANNLNMFRRADELHLANLNPPLAPAERAGELRESVWAAVWHGKYDSAAGYGRRADQSYDGIQVGYDKLLSKPFCGGSVYTGFYISKINGDSHTATGGGEQDSHGIGLYGSWVGDKGHYVDVAVNAAKIKNEYYFTANTGDGTIGRVDGKSNTWGYGLGLQYGKRNLLADAWFWEPSLSFFLGHVDENSYALGNGLHITEKGYDTAIGKAGLKAGRDFGEGAQVYAGVNYGHDFASGQDIYQRYGTSSRRIDTAGGHDSWWEWRLGGRVKISPTGIFTLDYLKTTGSDVGNDWSINGGFNWRWSGFGSGSNKSEQAFDYAPPAATATTVVIGKPKPMPEPEAPAATASAIPGIEAGLPVSESELASQQTAGQSGTEDAAEYTTEAATAADNAGPAAIDYTPASGEYALAPITVEASRPGWEKKLSPGQVSVIYPQAFEGEQKNLPELLDRVPGLFIQRINGVGHYTVARMRGSTAAQVAVFVDGVMMNLTGDAAVNLSAIPAENIERIEVYRGYVPARFAGAPMGGVINIVTKKPQEGQGHIRQGVRSHGGYTADYEYSMPLGSGSLLATFSRDIWQGDFDWTYPSNYYADKTFTRRSNDYQNNNGMLKWQGEHWTVKAAWKKLDEGLAKAIVDSYHNYSNSPYSDGRLKIDYQELLIGRRDTIGNLDYGWHVAYLDSDKHYTNTGGYRAIAELNKPETDYLPGQLWGNYHSKKWNGNLNMAMKMANHLLEFNADLTRETMRTNGNRWDLSQEAIDRQTGVNYTIRKMLSKYNNREYHLTLQDTVTLNDAGDLKLTPILRADKVEMEGLGPMGSDDSRWRYSGGVALQKQINDQWSFKSTWGTYNRHPNFYEIFGDGGFIAQNYVFSLAGEGGVIDAGLWERGRQFDFSLNWQGEMANADTDTILTYYKRRAENQLVLWTPRGGSGLSAYCPTGIIDVYGLELSHNMKWQRVNLAVAATWQKSKELDGGLGYKYNWAQSGASFVPEWVVSARLDYLFPGDKLNVFGEYRYTAKEVLRGEDSSGEDNPNVPTDVRDAYSLVDLGIKYKFDKNWRLSAGVNDVFDQGKDVYITRNMNRDMTPSYYPLAGRTYYTTMEYRF